MRTVAAADRAGGCISYVSKLASTYGSRVALSSGAALAAAGYGLLLNVVAGSYWLHVFPGVLIIAIRMAVIVAPLTNAVLSSVSLSYTATAAGFNSAISRTGSLIAIAASGAVMMGATDSMLRAFHGATFVGLVLCALSAVLARLALPRATAERETPQPRAIHEA